MFKVKRLSFVFSLFSFLICSCQTTQSVPLETKRLSLAVWRNYLPPSLIEEFELKTGIKVAATELKGNEELYYAVSQNRANFDLIFPTDYLVSVLSEEKRLLKLDHTKIPGLKNLEGRYLHLSSDPMNDYSVPLDWSTTGIAINRKLYSGKIEAWVDFFERPNLSKKTVLLDDFFEVVCAAMKAKSIPLNSHSKASLTSVRKYLSRHKARFQSFSDDPIATMLDQSYFAAQAYVSDAVRAARDPQSGVEFILPKEGSVSWTDNMVIPLTSTNPRAAYQFINFLLEPRNSARFAEFAGVTPCVKESLEFLSPDFRTNPNIFLPENIRAQFDYLENQGDLTEEWRRAFNQIRSKP